MIALFIPWLLLLILVVIIFFLIRKKWRVALLLISIMLAVNWWSECIPFRICILKDSNNSNRLSIMCFNIDGSDGDIDEKAKNVREFIKHYSPDIVFIAEFNEQSPNPLNSI